MSSFFQTLHLNSTMKTTRMVKKPTAQSQRPQMLRQYAEATLGSASLREAVLLPEGEDMNEWIAVHVVDFTNQINMLYGAITEFCSPHSCPKMTATESYEYLWQDGSEYKKPTRLSAPDYVEHLMQWSQAYFDNSQYFPTQPGQHFSKEAPSVFRKILKRMFRVYAHIYCHHFDQIVELGLEPHLNTSLKHFCLFCREFDLIDDKEYAPLKELVAQLIDNDGANKV